MIKIRFNFWMQFGIMWWYLKGLCTEKPRSMPFYQKISTNAPVWRVERPRPQLSGEVLRGSGASLEGLHPREMDAVGRLFLRFDCPQKPTVVLWSKFKGGLIFVPYYKSINRSINSDKFHFRGPSKTFLIAKTLQILCPNPRYTYLVHSVLIN